MPFGKRELSGIVTKVSDTSSYHECKDIIDVLDERALVSSELLQLTKWISDYYLGFWGQSVQLALPRGLEYKTKRVIDLVKGYDPDEYQLTERQKFLYDIIAFEPGKSTTFYKTKFGSGSFYYLLNSLKNKGLLHIRDSEAVQPVRRLKKRFITVNESIDRDLKCFRNREELSEILQRWAGQKMLFSEFKKRTSYSQTKIKKIADHGLIVIQREEVDRNYVIEYQEEKRDIVLNTAQVQALTEIQNSMQANEFRVHLLHGITGSGKTQVYLEAIKSTIAVGKSAIVLIPEISLTPQTVRRFENYFPNQVAVFHSKMTLGERHDAWMKVYDRKYSIVVGPRSALFMPLNNIGIIVVDEEHDASYKQSGSVPRYHARDVAVYRAKINNAVVVLGSATPSLESYYNAQQKKYNLLELSKRIMDVKLPKVFVVDMKGLHKPKDRSKLFSLVLVDKIADRLAKKEQIILLQNRRGYSAFLQCTDCGYIAVCPNCEISLTYHSFNQQLQCHYCGYSTRNPGYCPKCQGENINYLGSGTQRIEKELRQLFPQVRLIRMDLDTTKQKGAHDRILKFFKEGEAEILLGTQMIAKGLDFANVTLVGVISADIGLTLPDYRASERVFQLLTQVAGRAGRSILKGEVVIQSYLYTHYAIQFARNHDYCGFYGEEIIYRKKLDYPPFVRMINIRISGPDLSDTIHNARRINKMLKQSSRGLYVITGPAPCPISKIKNMYRWQTIIKLNSQKDPSGKRSKEIILKCLAPHLRLEQKQLRIALDVDPVDMM